MKKHLFIEGVYHKSFISLKILKIMRNALILLFLPLLQLLAENTYSQNTKLSLDLKNVKIENVLEEIEKQSEFYFAYNYQLVDVSHKVDVKVVKQPISEILSSIFSNSDVAFMVLGRQILLSPKQMLVKSRLKLQPKTISGVISDPDGVPLIGATVSIKGTTIGTISDANGNYSISNIPEDAILVFSFIGMKSQEISTGTLTEINVSMVQDVLGLDEVVVVGYGTARKSDLTGSIVSISAGDIENLPNPNIMDQVQGRLPGLSIVNTSVSPGADPNILIRGINSLTASNYPLIILDGIPYDGSISSINPGDIESLNVLKDASATAIYGARGSNGVILITTKKGQMGAPIISLDSRISINKVARKLDLLDADEYVDYKNTFGTSYPLYPSELANLNAGKTTDWQDEALRTAIMYEHSASIRGGSEKLNYFVSLGRLEQEGLVLGSEYNRTSFRVNGAYAVTDWLEIGTQSLVSGEDWGDQGDIWVHGFTLLSPLGTPYNDDGSNTLYPVPEDSFFTNPLDDLNNTVAPTRRKLHTNLYTQIDFPFLTGLSYRLNFGRSEQHYQTDVFNPSWTLKGAGGGSASRSSQTAISTTTENILKYNREFGDHRVDFTALYSFQENTNDNINVSGNNFVTDNLEYYGVGGAANQGISTPYSETAIISQMGRLNYGFKGKYNATYTLRRDGYSGFGSNRKFGVFQSGAVTWTISEEAFLQNTSWLDFLKLRISYGTSGNQAIPPYGSLTRVSQTGTYYFDDTAFGFGPANLGNPDLGWESTNTLNFGLDFAVLGSRLSGTLEYYHTTSNDLLYARKLNATQGFSSMIQNIGALENKGLELSLNGVIVNGADFRWDANATFFMNRNKIVSLADSENDDLASLLFIGEDINTIFGYVFDGVYDDQAEIDASHEPSAKPGDAIIRDVDGDRTITPDDRTFLGTRSPDFTMGITNSLSYKNFDLSFFIYILEGEQRENNIVDSRYWSGEARINYIDIDFWTPTNMDAKYPRPTYYNPLLVKMIEDRDYIRLKNITLGYTFQNDLIARIGLNSLRVYVAGNNLLTITKWTGYDPETLNSGGELSAYPSARSFVFGINVGL